jgi:hypothetical protein
MFLTDLHCDSCYCIFILTYQPVHIFVMCIVVSPWFVQESLAITRSMRNYIGSWWTWCFCRILNPSNMQSDDFWCFSVAWKSRVRFPEPLLCVIIPELCAQFQFPLESKETGDGDLWAYIGPTVAYSNICVIYGATGWCGAGHGVSREITLFSSGQLEQLHACTLVICNRKQ